MSATILQRAQAGDADAFGELTDPYRRELHLHCYRILGSFQDAEDVLQETLLSAWQALNRFDGHYVKAWLYRIATNRCLNHLRDSARRPAIVPPPPLPAADRASDPAWLEPYPDVLIPDESPGPEARYEARESVALSFIAGLQHLPARQRAVLVLRDVLGFSATETAEILDTSATAVNSALQRARSEFHEPQDSDRVALPDPGQESKVVAQFVDAFERGDIDGVVALLTADARVTMPPEPFEFRGPAAISAFYRQQGFWGQDLKLVPTAANGQPAFGYYLPDPNSNVYRAGGILVLTVTEDGISAITRFGEKSLLARFGLRRSVPRS